jgi:hypothetical protein
MLKNPHCERPKLLPLWIVSLTRGAWLGRDACSRGKSLVLSYSNAMHVFMYSALVVVPDNSVQC